MGSMIHATRHALVQGMRRDGRVSSENTPGMDGYIRRAARLNSIGAAALPRPKCGRVALARPLL
jgi:hypothetical protein